ncbi:MAG: 2-succinyl-5-enolpyruvyl-6-hydroxy-3-cyclohexene-1-carboxylic-acid synthase [Cyanobacteria bacterium J06648_16]
MSLDYRNTNSLWASVAVKTLVKLGLKTAVVCPGSRSTPLTYALAVHRDIDTIPILDERSAAFFALGCAKQQGQPVVLVCTSGTAGANFYPAVIEAYESQVPLLVMTADRPPELRDCGAGQAIDQQKLYGDFVVAQIELAVPVASHDMLAYLRQTLVQLWLRSQHPQSGPVHLNGPFRDPLPPVPESGSLTLRLNEATFFASVQPVTRPQALPIGTPLEIWEKCDRGLIIAGPAQPQNPLAYCQAVARLSKWLGWPVLAEGLSPLRNYQAQLPYLISTYNILLRSPEQAEQLYPSHVIQLGPLPTSKLLRQWLAQMPHQRWVIAETQRNLDPTHGQVQQIPVSVFALAQQLPEQKRSKQKRPRQKETPNPYLNQWRQAEQRVRPALNQEMAQTDALFEGKVAWTLAQHLPERTPVFVANSMPVRDVEAFWQPNDRQYSICFSRGANGIDGTLSTALGMVQGGRQGVLLTGDLALLHDTNGFLSAQHLQGHLTIVLINNQGGGIFEMLPISEFEPPFEKFFATPQKINFRPLCKAYDIEYTLINSWVEFNRAISSLPEQGIRLLEIRTHRKLDAQRRWQIFQRLSSSGI